MLVALMAGIYVAVFRVLVPKSAAAFMPVHWRNIPLGETRKTVHSYLGSPAAKSGSADQWVHRLTDHKRYVLKIKYDANGRASYYKLDYEVLYGGFRQSARISTDSVSQ